MKNIVRYVRVRLQREARDQAYRFYVCDCLRMISRNTARREGSEYMAARYSDIIRKKPQESGEEIAARIIAAVTGEAVSE